MGAAARLGGVVAAVALAACSEAADIAPQSLPRSEITVGNYNVAVQVADDNAERSKGLMFAKTMPENEGMLFVWPEAEVRSFWMRNTYLPLDLLYIRGGEIVKVISWARPLDETPLPSGEPVDTVLEMNGGWAVKHGIGVGDRVRY